MFCPRCSLEQLTEGQKFCSRCGLPLEGVAQLVAAGGRSPDIRDRKRSPKFRGVRQGTAFLMLAVVLLPLVDIIPDPFHEALIFVFLLAGVMRIAFALLFLEGQQAAEVGETPTPAKMSPLQQPASEARSLTTAPIRELIMPARSDPVSADPPTATEGTTELLAKDSPPPAR